MSITILQRAAEAMIMIDRPVTFSPKDASAVCREAFKHETSGFTIKANGMPWEKVVGPPTCNLINAEAHSKVDLRVEYHGLVHEKTVSCVLCTRDICPARLKSRSWKKAITLRSMP